MHFRFQLLPPIYNLNRKGIFVIVLPATNVRPCYAALACVIVLACVLWLQLPNDRRPTLRPSKKPARGARAKETRGRSMLCQRKCKERQKEWKCGRKRSKKEALNWQKLGEIVKSSVARPPATLLSFSWLLSERWPTLLSCGCHEEFLWRMIETYKKLRLFCVLVLCCAVENNGQPKQSSKQMSWSKLQTNNWSFNNPPLDQIKVIGKVLTVIATIIIIGIIIIMLMWKRRC